MNDELRNRIVAIFERIEGGSHEDMMFLLDVAIEDGDITQEEYRENEIEICDIFDASWFTCSRCSWTLPIADMASDVPDGEDDWICSDCAKENGYED